MQESDIEKVTELFKQKYINWTNNPARKTNGYSYERTFVEMMHEFESELFQHSLGELSTNRNEKKSPDEFRKN